MSYSTKVIRRIYNDDSEDYIQVAPDGDGLGLIDILQVENGEEVARLSMPYEAAYLLSRALANAYEEE